MLMSKGKKKGNRKLSRLMYLHHRKKKNINRLLSVLKIGNLTKDSLKLCL